MKVQLNINGGQLQKFLNLSHEHYIFFFSVSGYNGTPCLYISEFSPQILDLKFNVFTTTLT